MAKIDTCSVWDLQCSLKLSIEYYTANDFRKAILAEKINRNRVSILKLLNRGFIAKLNGKERI